MDGPVGFRRQQRQHASPVVRQGRLVVDRVSQLPEDEPRVRLHADAPPGIPAQPRARREGELGPELVAARVSGRRLPNASPSDVVTNGAKPWNVFAPVSDSCSPRSARITSSSIGPDLRTESSLNGSTMRRLVWP